MITKQKQQDILGMASCELGAELSDACKRGNIELVQYLLTSPYLDKHADIHYQHSGCLIQAAYHNRFEIMEYLLSSPELTTHADYKYCDEVISIACLRNYLSTVKYYLNHPKVDVTQSSLDYDFLPKALCNGNLDITQYLLSSTELKNNAQLHLEYEDLFADLCRPHRLSGKHWTTLEYLIFDLNIPYSPYVANVIKKNDIVKALFEKREFNEQLNEKLSISNQEQAKRVKI